MPIDLLLLGRPCAERDGEPVELPAKALALLAYLAANIASHPRERILGLLWAESAEEAARKNLRNTLWTIRKGLGEDAVRAQGDRLSLGVGVASDVRRLPEHPLDDPAGLLDLYRGPFLDGLSLAEAPEFELWLSAARESFAQMFLRRVQDAFDLLAERAEWTAAADLARRGLAHDPTNEPLARGLMTALAEQGQRGEALKQYEALKAALEAELGVAPSPETTARRDALARDARRRTARSGGVTTPTPAEREAQFVGRATERAALDAELALARGGQARVVLLTGELGIGKSRLWREWSRSLPAESRPLEARCVEAASGLPFAPLVELFSADPRMQELLRPPSPLPDVWLAEVARLLPGLRAESPGLLPPPPLPPEEERRRVFEAFAQALLALDAQPLILFVDDVHWTDRATLDWISYLVYRMRGRSLLLVLAYRPEEAPPALIHQVAAWGREGALRRLPLPRLAPEETALLIGGLRVGPPLAHTLQARSAGNPYFLLELSRSAEDADADSVPPALVDLVRSRLERLSEGGRAALQAAAVLDPEFDLPLLVTMTGRDEDEIVDALDELLGSGVLVERDGRFGFNHPLLPQVVRDGMNAARASVMNRRAARALVSERGQRIEAVAGLISDHFAAADERPEAARYADLAADRAQSLSAIDEEARFRQRAQQLEPSARRALRLGEALLRAGRMSAAREAYGVALAEAEKAGDARLAARACLGIGDTYVPSGWVDEALHWAERSLHYLDPEGDPAGHAHAHFLLGVGRLRRGGADLEQAERDLTESVRIARESGIPDLGMAQFELANARAERGDLAGAVELYAQTAELAAKAGDPNRQVLALNNLAYHLMLLGKTGEAAARIDAALELAASVGLALPLDYLYSTRGEIYLAEARWDEAERWVNKSLAEARGHNNVTQMTKCRANLARIAQGRGDLDTALILLEEAGEMAAPLPARFMQSQIDLWLVEVYLARGERSAAAGALERAESRLAGSHYGGLLARARELRRAVAA